MFSGKSYFQGHNQDVKKLQDEIQHLAATKAPVLITGEKGSGKSFLAKYTHSLSSRKNNPLYVIDCSANFSEVRNQILGYRDATGSFNKGAFETGHTGTVVLENIESLEEKFQDKLHTIIQDLKDYDLDIRLIATTTKNLQKLVSSGAFSRSLYSFFASNCICTVPLRERKEDLKYFVSQTIQVIAQKEGVEAPQVKDDFNQKISEQYLSENFNELIEIIRSCFQKRTDNTLSFQLDNPDNTSSFHSADESNEIKLMSLKDAEKILIQKALIHTAENRTQAAKILGVSIRTLRNKINEYRVKGHNYFINLR